MSIRLRHAGFASLLAAAVIAGWTSASSLVAVAAPPSPSPTPTPEPTPFMELALIPNGTWDVIIQGREIQYSKMKLKADGTAISGVWSVDRKTTYVVTGIRDGAHLKLDLKASTAPDAPLVGKIDATLDGIADMYGLITVNGVDMPFQGAQHTRVPPPVDNGSPAPGGQMPGGPGMPTPYH